MSIITTDLRETLDWANARRIRFEPTPPITATNLQDAITQDILIPKTIVTTPVVFAQSPYTPTNSDSYLAVDTSGGAVTINLQTGAARVGLPLAIKDVTGNAVANPISVVPSGAETIDGLAPYPIDGPFSAIQLYPKAAGGYAVAS